MNSGLVVYSIPFNTGNQCDIFVKKFTEKNRPTPVDAFGIPSVIRCYLLKHLFLLTCRLASWYAGWHLSEFRMMWEIFHNVRVDWICRTGKWRTSNHYGRMHDRNL